MGDFYIEVGNVKPFIEGKCSYNVVETKPYKDENENKSIILKCNIKDIDGTPEKASVFLSKNNLEVIDAFCKINNIELKSMGETKILRPEDCMGKKNGICMVKRAKNPKYLNIISFLDEKMPADGVTESEESFKDDIPF